MQRKLAKFFVDNWLIFLINVNRNKLWNLKKLKKKNLIKIELFFSKFLKGLI